MVRSIFKNCAFNFSKLRVQFFLMACAIFRGRLQRSFLLSFLIRKSVLGHTFFYTVPLLFGGMAACPEECAEKNDAPVDVVPHFGYLCNSFMYNIPNTP